MPSSYVFSFVFFVVKVLVFPITRDIGDHVRSRRFQKLRGAIIAAPQPVILKERPLSPRMKDPNRRNPLCSPLPVYFSQPPPGGITFVENKRPTPIRPSGDRAVEALFLSFLPVESVSFCWSFCPCNPLPTVRSAVGRGMLNLPNYQITHLPNSVGTPWKPAIS